MSARLATDMVSPGERVDWWRERVLELFGSDYCIEPSTSEPFSISVELEPVAPIAFLKIRGSAHKAAGRGEPSGDPKLLVHLQVKGHCTVFAEGRETLLGPGTLSLFPVRESTHLQFHEAYDQIATVLPVELLERMVPNWSRHVAKPIATETGTAAVLADHLVSLSRHPDALAQGRSSALVHLTVGMVGALLQEMCGHEPRDSSTQRAFQRERIKQFALNHLANPVLDCQFISRGVGLSTRYIHQLFHDQPLTLMQWVLQERLTRCHDELARGVHAGRTLCELAYAWGFNDQAHFTHSFRKLFGVSPSELKLGQNNRRTTRGH